MSLKEQIHQVLKKTNSIWLGKEEKAKMALLSVLCGGHLLIEDIPGVGKTTLAKTLGLLLGVKFSRIQFTNDLLPGDILGTHIFSKEKEEFLFKKGPLFSNLILVDELNRATPKTQSALLEAMEEEKITVEGKTFDLEFPFVVMATQNPFGQVGTFPLPESQRDRFFMSLSLGLPEREIEKKILMMKPVKEELEGLEALLSRESLYEIRKCIILLEFSDPLVHYVLDFIEFVRSQKENSLPVSPRCGQDLLLASKGHAFMEGRGFVIPEDVQSVAPHVIGHRLFSHQNIDKAQSLIKEMIPHVAIP
jgi:MoxR-like ATPase